MDPDGCKEDKYNYEGGPSLSREISCSLENDNPNEMA